MRALFLLSAAASAASCISADQVLVLGKAPSPVWHETRSSAALSAPGLVDLALNSLGLSTGRVSSRSAVQNPIQADIFAHSEAYALFLLDDTASASLETVNAALSGSEAFHKLYTAEASNVKVPVAVAQEFGAKYPSGLRCAGSAALCASVKAETPAVTAELVQNVLSANSFLSSGDEQDVAFAKELAQVMQLTAKIKQQTEEKTLYVVGLSGLKGDKQKTAQQAVAATVTEFLAELMKSEKVVAAQIMTGSLPTAVQQTAALSRRARNRKLASGLTNEVVEEESDESDESEESEESDESEQSDESGLSETSGDTLSEASLVLEDLTAASGSVWEDDVNSTTTANSTAAHGAVSMSDIAEYQIILWTSILLGAVLLMAVLAMANMDVGRDSLLYAKFIADVSGRKTN